MVPFYFSPQSKWNIIESLQNFRLRWCSEHREGGSSFCGAGTGGTLGRWSDWVSLVEISSRGMVMLDTACSISAAMKACVPVVSLFSAETYDSYSDIIVSLIKPCPSLVSDDICSFRCLIFTPLSTMKTCLLANNNFQTLTKPSKNAWH